MEVPPTFEASDSFAVRLVNHRTPLHVHLHLDDTLSRVAELDASNHYVEGESERLVDVRVTEELQGEVFGRLKVVSAYGATTRWVDVVLSPPEDEEGRVEVDASLAEPQPENQAVEAGSTATPRSSSELAVAGLALVAALVAVVAAAVAGNVLALVGALTVLAGVVVALFVLLS